MDLVQFGHNSQCVIGRMSGKSNPKPSAPGSSGEDLEMSSELFVNPHETPFDIDATKIQHFASKGLPPLLSSQSKM